MKKLSLNGLNGLGARGARRNSRKKGRDGGQTFITHIGQITLRLTVAGTPPQGRSFTTFQIAGVIAAARDIVDAAMSSEVE